jgi:hypothetical protein
LAKTPGKNPEKKEVPPSYPKQPGEAEDAGIAVGRVELKQLSSAQLYKVLVLKNVPGRSKLRSKTARRRALDGRVTAADLASAGVLPVAPVRESSVAPTPKKQFHVTLPKIPQKMGHQGKPRPRRPGDGERFEVPVAGIDVHVDPLVVAIVDTTGLLAEERFPYSSSGIEDIRRFLRCHHVQHVAMESTAEYWIRVFWR